MINITRQTNSPPSLLDQVIQNYLDALELHKDDPDTNPKPDQPLNYRTSDLLEAFDSNFFSKCYLTEQKFENSWAMDVEHFIPRIEDAALIYEWTNLYPASSLANGIKPRATPAGGYLKPCDPNENVETEIIYTLSAHGFSPNFEPQNPNNIKAINTCTLLDRIHNGHNDNTKKRTEDLRHSIHKKYIEILNKIVEWRNSADNSQQKRQIERELRDMLSRRSSFTMLCRSMPAVVSSIPQNFLD